MLMSLGEVVDEASWVMRAIVNPPTAASVMAAMDMPMNVRFIIPFPLNIVASPMPSHVRFATECVEFLCPIG